MASRVNKAFDSFRDAFENATATVAELNTLEGLAAPVDEVAETVTRIDCKYCDALNEGSALECRRCGGPLVYENASAARATPVSRRMPITTAEAEQLLSELAREIVQF